MIKTKGQTVSEYTDEASQSDQSWRGFAHRAVRLVRRRQPKSRSRWSVIGVVVLFGAGMLFSTSAIEANGTSLRTDQGLELREVIPQRNEEVRQLEDESQQLRDEVDGLTDDLGSGNNPIELQQKRADSNKQAAGLTAVHGPAVRVSLDDAPHSASQLPAGAKIEDVVVHQQDVQAVVNALWSGGAEAVTIMGVRVVSTSAVRCVGNTLLLHGQVYSPPFVITAIGDVDSMSTSLNATSGVLAFRDAAEDYGLGYTAEKLEDVEMPAYDGPIDMHDAEVP